jgi:hypothetical protein
MIKKFLNGAKLSIIERGIVMKAYEILQGKTDDILIAMDNMYDIVHEEVIRNIALTVAIYEKHSTLDKRIFGGCFVDLLGKLPPNPRFIMCRDTGGFFFFS